jgi:arylsulfatase A-like enzyme
VSRPLRYTFILALTTAATVLAAAGGWRYARASAPVNGPIILISIDTLRADHLPAYGYRAIKTPAIDTLAADGVLFERAYAHATLTWPSHAALLTGRLPTENGVRTEAAALGPGERLLPQMLHDRGYATAAIVGDAFDADSGINRGFDMIEEDSGQDADRAAARWLDDHGRSRAFLFFHVDETKRPYDDGVSAADAIVGVLVRYLKSHQLYDRSTIILLSDHGEGLGDHGEDGHGLLLEEETIHVPLIVKQESNEGAGRRVKDLVQLIDVAPTVLDLIKSPGGGSLPGRSLKPLLDGSGTLAPAAVYSEAMYAKNRFGWGELVATTDEHGRVVRVVPGPDGAPAVDPREKAALVETIRRAESRADAHRWTEAVTLMQEAVAAEPEMADLWAQLASYATIVGRLDTALDAYWHVTMLDNGPRGYLGAASTLLKQQKPRDAAAQAAIALDLATNDAEAADAHELLARIAIARRDPDAARAEAVLAQQADPKRPLKAFVDGRLLYDQGKYTDAIAPFEAALAATRESKVSVADLHYLAGDTYAHLNRPGDAEAQFKAEIEAAPSSVRARVALVSLYRAADRGADADHVIEAMTREVPTPESSQAAARLLARGRRATGK